MVIAGGGVEHGARGGLGIGDLEGALLDAVGQDMGDLIDQALLVRLHDLAGLLRQRQIGLKHLRVFADLLVFDVEHGAEPFFQPRRRGTGGFRDLLQRRVGAVEPAFCHRLAQRCLARKMAVDAAVADIERTGNVHNRGLGQSKPAQDVFGGFENPLRGQNDDFIHEGTLCVSWLVASIQRANFPISRRPGPRDGAQPAGSASAGFGR